MGKERPDFQLWKVSFKEGVLTDDKIEALRVEIETEINENLKLAFDEEEIQSEPEQELLDVYAPFKYEETNPGSVVEHIRLVDAISKGLKQSMGKHSNLVIMGQDVADYGGESL